MPRNLVETATWSSPITVPLNGEPAQVETTDPPLQALANRSKYIGDRIVADEWTYPAPKTRTLRLMGIAWPTTFDGTNIGWAPNGNGEDAVGFRDNVDNYLDLHKVLPEGVTITSVSFSVSPGAARAGAARMQLALRDESGVVASTDDGGAAGPGYTLRTLSGLSLVVQKNVAGSARLYMQAGDDGGSHNNDFVNFVEIVFAHPGPRF